MSQRPSENSDNDNSYCTSSNAGEVSLDDRYVVISGRVLLSGIQALVRLPLDQMRRDRARNLNTGTFISGYRGSPLGGYDAQLARNKELLEESNIRFQPGVNEELGATAVWGSQQVNLFDGATVDGVCGIWYGKTPGVDRSTDAFRHANAAGSARYGGVLVVAGDDHGCKSSTYPGQSEFAFVDMHMPILSPSNVQEVLEFGLYGFELSRFSGCWVALITLSENMDSSATVDVGPDLIDVVIPTDVEMPDGGLNIRLHDTPIDQEERLWRYKRPAALAFARENSLNRVIVDAPDAQLGIVTSGKAHLDLMQALQNLDIDEDRARELGIRILKVGMTYPLDVDGVVQFARGLECLFVVEEKRALIEVQLKEDLYNLGIADSCFPRIIGKRDHLNNPLLPSYGELSPDAIAEILLRLLPEPLAGGQDIVDRSCPTGTADEKQDSVARPKRSPYFCSGCPHSTSTRVPEGSRALAGIGCHYLAQGMNRETYTYTQMGGEGVPWIGQKDFTRTRHVFVNLGDGTYFHSGVLAIRAAVAAGANITYKILFNDAVAMTGGQQHDGDLSPQKIIRQVLAEGVTRVVLMTDDTRKYQERQAVPEGVELRHRDDLDEVQRELRETSGVTCIVYAQTCATELRRKRKRGLVSPSKHRVVINDMVCEGCGDCSAQSNCISVEPKETAFGTKRQINQTSCNQDMSCLKGFCPSFVVVEGADAVRSPTRAAEIIELCRSLPEPVAPDLKTPWSIIISGVGGTGVVTLGALLAMAAFIEGNAVTTLDQTGLAQKGGAVYSHIRIASNKADLHAVRISAGGADALIACDLVGAIDEDACMAKLDGKRTQCVVNSGLTPTGAFVLGDEGIADSEALLGLLRQRCSAVMALDALELARCAFGGTTLSNMVLLGVAFQEGLLPVGLAALYQAVELNGVAVEDNIAAINLGRLYVADRDSLVEMLNLAVDSEEPQEALVEVVAHRSRHLTAYQNPEYAEKYRKLVAKVQAAEAAVAPGSEKVAIAVARNAAKLMAYKDEYEVARLYSDGQFMADLRRQFKGDYKLKFSLAPPILSAFGRKGRDQKILLGGWMIYVFRVLARLKGLRGTWLDIFSYSKERRSERELIHRYEEAVDQVLSYLSQDNLELAARIASIPDEIRGFGHVKERSRRNVINKWDTMLSGYIAGAKDSRDQDVVRIIDAGCESESSI